MRRAAKCLMPRLPGQQLPLGLCFLTKGHARDLLEHFLSWSDGVWIKLKSCDVTAKIYKA